VSHELERGNHVSRSKRKQPYHGATGARSEKQCKRKANRVARRTNRQILSETGDAEALKERKELIDPWDMAKDGKIRFDANKNPRWMRK